MKVLSLSLVLIVTCLAACGQAPTGQAHAVSGTQTGNRSNGQSAAHGVLSKEEVAAILGKPVTSVEGAATDMHYRTDVLALEASIDIESEHDPVEAMAGARKATAMLGGTAEDVPKLGDEAFFGAMSFLYVRKGDTFITITPPNLQQVAAMAAYGKVTEAKLGSDEQVKALQDFAHVEQSDPLAAGLKGGDAMQGALNTVAAASKKQGTTLETEARAMAVALAAKVLTKL